MISILLTLLGMRICEASVAALLWAVSFLLSILLPLFPFASIDIKTS